MGGVNAPVLPLGDLLRTGRERLQPDEVGLTAGAGRRAKGLRREELAMLAGLSVDYLTRLEQGRASSPSPQVLRSLARALRLDPDEEALLFTTAGYVPPSREQLEDEVPPGIGRMITRLGELPIGVFGADWTLLDASPSFAVLFGVEGGADGRPMNLARFTFLHHRESPAPATPEDRAALEAAVVADLRRSAGRYGEDPRFRELLEDLRAGSDRFGRLWEEGRAVPHRSMRKAVVHELTGPLELDCDVMVQPGSDVRMVVYSAPAGTASERALSRLREIAGDRPVALAR